MANITMSTKHNEECLLKTLIPVAQSPLSFLAEQVTLVYSS